MGVLVRIWEKLSGSVSKDSFDESLISSGLDLRVDGVRSRPSAEGPVLFDDSVGDSEKTREALNFPEITEEVQGMARSDERGKPMEPEGKGQDSGTEALDSEPESETNGLDLKGSSGFGELSLDIFDSDGLDDEDDHADMPDDLADVNIEALLAECRSVGEQLLGSGQSESEK